jgi:CubicO group peptidase (beta-lactamase class C family)
MSAIIARDAKGTFVGSSFMYASARDWARIGLLYANDGVWNGGQRILPKGWVDYSRTRGPVTTKEEKTGALHGAHFWVRLTDWYSQKQLPVGIFHMSGHEGQFVTIIPEKNSSLSGSVSRLRWARGSRKNSSRRFSVRLGSSVLMASFFPLQNYNDAPEALNKTSGKR